MAVETLLLPTPTDVAKLIGELLDRHVAIRPVDPLDIDPAVHGVFANPYGDGGVVMASDIELANYAGAALSLMPVDAAEEGVRAREVTAGALENYREVINIVGTLLNRRGGVHVRLWYVLDDKTPLFEGLPAALAAADKRADFVVEIEGYGSGRMNFRVWP